VILLCKRQLSTEEIESNGLPVRNCRLFQHCSKPFSVLDVHVQLYLYRARWVAT